jgi:transglutaminase-like putative cysteine protease
VNTTPVSASISASDNSGHNSGVRLEVVHDTRYTYSAPVSVAQHLAHVQPLQDPHQTLLSFDLQVTPAPAARIVASVDAQGNTQHHFSLYQAHRFLNVRATSQVRIWPRFTHLQSEASPPWDQLAAQLHYAAGGHYEPAVQWAQPSPYVPRLSALRVYAEPSFTPGRPVAAAALHLMQRVHQDFVYDSRSTQIDTPLATVLQQRRGVCQDFAHLVIGALRSMGLPARYVSGYLLTQSSDGKTTMLGADASHAWVQVWCPGTPGVPAPGQVSNGSAGWLSLDPTNNLVPSTGHVRVAIGRDFGDVTPLRGVIRGGGGNHTLSVGVSTRLISPAADLHPGMLQSA